MAAPQAFVPIAEAAFIADLSQPQMNRLFDEGLVPADLLAQDTGSRRFSRLSAAFAKFFFETDRDLAASTRKRVLVELTQRVQAQRSRDGIFSLSEPPRGVDWKVSVSAAVTVDVYPFVSAAMARARQADNANQLVTEDPDILGGTPCFAGTRVPIETVLASLDAEISKARVLKAYPFLTDAHIEAARIYARVHPRRGRPRRIGEANPSLLRTVAKVVRAARP